MNKDLEAFEGWFEVKYNEVILCGETLGKWTTEIEKHRDRRYSEKAWQAACSHKQSEIDELKQVVRELKECCEFYANATNNPKKYMRQGYEVYNLKKAIFIDGGERARQVLERNKEILGRVE